MFYFGKPFSPVHFLLQAPEKKESCETESPRFLINHVPEQNKWKKKESCIVDVKSIVFPKILIGQFTSAENVLLKQKKKPTKHLEYKYASSY